MKITNEYSGLFETAMFQIWPEEEGGRVYYYYGKFPGHKVGPFQSREEATAACPGTPIHLLSVSLEGRSL